VDKESKKRTISKSTQKLILDLSCDDVMVFWKKYLPFMTTYKFRAAIGGQPTEEETAIAIVNATEIAMDNLSEHFKHYFLKVDECEKCKSKEPDSWHNICLFERNLVKDHWEEALNF
jgi:hypothetical protein